MIRTLLNLSWIVSIVLLVSACNDSIFVDDTDLPDDTHVLLEGDGGEWSAAYSRHGLKRILFDYSYGYDEYLTYYDVNENPVEADIDPSQLKSIVYENPLRHYSIVFDGDMIYITSHYNASFADSFDLRLVYDSGTTKSINVQVEQGAQVERGFWQPSGDLKINENIEHETHRSSLTNNSSLVQKLEIMPYLDARCSDVANPAGQWALGLNLTMPMLSYHNDEWVWILYDDIRLGHKRIFVSSWSADDKIVVEVPPHKKAIVTYTLNYSLATEAGKVQFHFPNDDRYYEEEVTWISIYATGYDYKVEYE
ncbi:MAG: hypothetical protein K2K93_01555 [Muribaculaceae bacterium]|nr:hypothetical protein [Muribaculaceae bacterium]